MSELLTLHANGTSSSPIPTHAEELNIILDGRTLSGHQPHQEQQKLDESIHYRLKKMEPQKDGTCLLQYVKIQPESSPQTSAK